MRSSVDPACAIAIDRTGFNRSMAPIMPESASPARLHQVLQRVEDEIDVVLEPDL
jgi:hypothetical protein